MEAGYRTPLLDFFRRGDVARDIRLLAAQGALAPRAHEQLGLLVFLVSDHDPDIARAAEATLQAIPRDSLSAFLARGDVSEDMRSFFLQRGIEPAAVPSPDIDAPLVDAGGPGADVPEEEGEKTPEEKVSTLQKIAAMTVAQRMGLAMKGSREERAILIRDPNKIVAVAVLSSPKITEQEVGSIARMPNVSDEILRMIANTRAWIKNYDVVVGLTKNAKTPLAVSMNLLQRLNEKDLRMLSSDRNVPDVLRITARKKIVIDK
jgi:hypothetical protein